MTRSKRDALLDEIAAAKERRLAAIEADAPISQVRAIEDELAALRARQREEHPEDFASKDTRRELTALREQQVAELSALPRRTPDQEGRRMEFRTHLAELKGGK
jgi:hypothetical protein